MSKIACCLSLSLCMSLLLITAPAVFAAEQEPHVPPAIVYTTAARASQASSAVEGGGESGEAGEKDTSPMVLIPGGEFMMGVLGDDSDNPLHKVSVDTFYMDQHEVTNAQYFKFCQETERDLPEFWGWERFHSGPDYPDHPVVGVSWGDAQEYAEWCGKRLPTEAEWEYAGRGGLIGMNYPNGDTIDSTAANYFIKDAVKGTVPVGSYPPNGFGLYDMAGNVVEWVSDYYDWDYYGVSPYENPQGPEKGKFRVIRGGGWHSGPYCNRVHFRSGLRGNWVDFNVGFRCVKNYED